jgi:CheY-like chemotaxis protein
MANNRLFFLDTDGRLVGPESAPGPNEAETIAVALHALTLTRQVTTHTGPCSYNGSATKRKGTPARIVLVHDEPKFVDGLENALRRAGHQVATFSDPLTAWTSLEAPRRIEVLITRLEFPPGKSNGLALARMAHARHRDINVIFTATARFARQVDEVDTFLPTPVAPSVVVETVERMLANAQAA